MQKQHRLQLQIERLYCRGGSAANVNHSLTGSNPNTQKALTTGHNLAHNITPIFDKEAVTADVNAQVQITAAFGQSASKAVGDYASNKFNSLIKQAQEADIAGDKEKAAQLMAEVELWKEGGSARVALHTLIGALTGNISGAIGAASSQTFIPMLGEQIAKLDIPQVLKDTLIQTASLAIGVTTGGTAGAVSATNATGNNYLKHAELEKFAKELAQCKQDTTCNTNAIYAKYQQISDQNNQELYDAYLVGDYLKLAVINKDMLLSARTLAEVEKIFGHDWQTRAKFDDTYYASYGLTPAQSKVYGEDARYFANKTLFDLTAKMQNAGVSPEEQKRNLALLLDLTPGVSNGKALAELITGKDPVTEEEASRLWALVGVAAGGEALILKEAFAASKAAEALRVAEELGHDISSIITVNPSKYDYFFGRVISGNINNIKRSAQNLNDLTTLGIKTEQDLNIVFTQALKTGGEVSRRVDQYGTTIIRRVEISGKGAVDVPFLYRGGNLNSIPEVTSIIPKLAS